jgi:predicted CXXCH cytochrome family protein
MFRKFAGLTAIAGLFIAGAASAQIQGSVHDFTDDIAGNTDLCAFCHVPHDAIPDVTEAPLWDHTLTSASYTPYSSGTMNDTMSGNSTAYGISRLCLSCHDGTVAVDSYGGVTGTNLITNAVFDAGVGANYVSGDISQEHPVSVAGATSTDSNIKAAPTETGVLYYGDNVECASCHDVHDQTANSFLLTASTDASALCLACHIK